MKTELLYLVLVTVLTALLWIPYILDRIATWGPDGHRRLSRQAQIAVGLGHRMLAAHENAVENLVVFAALVLAAHAVGVSNAATAGACVVYFWARVVHVAAYTFKVPWVRTLAFTVGGVGVPDGHRLADPREVRLAP